MEPRPRGSDELDEKTTIGGAGWRPSSIIISVVDGLLSASGHPVTAVDGSSFRIRLAPVELPTHNSTGSGARIPAMPL